MSSILIMVLAYGEVMSKDDRFDIDLARGKVAENLINEIFRGEKVTIEVKHDFVVGRTGNVAIEYMDNNNPSGLLTSIADYYALVLAGEEYDDEVIILLKTERLKKIVNNYGLGKVSKLGRRKKEMMLIPLSDLLRKKSEL